MGSACGCSLGELELSPIVYLLLRHVHVSQILPCMPGGSRFRSCPVSLLLNTEGLGSLSPGILHPKPLQLVTPAATALRGLRTPARTIWEMPRHLSSLEDNSGPEECQQPFLGEVQSCLVESTCWVACFSQAGCFVKEAKVRNSLSMGQKPLILPSPKASGRQTRTDP